MPIPEPIHDLVREHFATRDAERDDARHLATHAPDAYLVVGEAALRRDEAEEADVLAAWAQAAERVLKLGRVEVTNWRDEGDRGVATLSAVEAATGEALALALGAVETEGGWKVGFVGLSDGAPKPYEEARFVALSELAAVRSMSASGALTSLLEAGWARTRWLPRQRMLALPETRFSCMGSGGCCTHELTIGLDENSRRFVEAVDWEAVAPHLPGGPYVEAMPEAASSLVSFRHKLARDERGRCRFLTDTNRCTIHGLAGRAVFKPCHVFPMRFAWSPDGVCVTTNHMCPTARHGQGLPMAAQEADLRSRMAVADVLRTDAYMLRPGEAVAWETFKTIEGQLLELLNGEAPIKQKLWVALSWLKERVADPAAGVDPAWYEESIPKLGMLNRLAVARFGALFDPCFKDLKGVEAGEESLPDVEAELSRFFRSFLFGKALTYPYGLVTGLNYLALTHHVLERQVGRSAKKGISEAFWREFYAVVTSGTYLRILEACHQTPATMLARVAATPSFGMNLLRLG